jgi:hypothetical protein
MLYRPNGLWPVPRHGLRPEVEKDKPAAVPVTQGSAT